MAEHTRERAEMLDIQGIIREGLKATNRNKKVVLFITLFSVPPFILISLAIDYVSIIPMKEVLTSAEWKNGESHKIAVSSVMSFLSALWVLGLMEMLATAYDTTTRSMTGAQMQREKMLLAAKTWRRITFTWLYIVIFSIVYIGGGISAILVAASASISVTIVTILAFTVKLLYLCLATVWMMALVISVIGEECYGLSSILEGGKFIKEKKFHGLSLMVLFMAPFIGNLALIRFMFLGFRADAIFWYAFVTFICILVCPMILFIFEVFSVFYLECLKSHGERDGRDGDRELKVVVVDVNQLK